ncbi:MAG: Flp pilus assembly protein CpaB [Pseudomonadota bacterium]
MSPMRLIILAVAGVAAVVAAFLVRNLADQPAPVVKAETVERIVEVEVSKAKVLVAADDLRVGMLLDVDSFQWIDWPEDAVNPGFYTQADYPEAMEELAGSVVRTALFMSEPILPQKIVKKGETGFMAALLRPGMRAVSVEISPESASAGFILPDDRVDVILTQEVEIPTADTLIEQTVTNTILQNVRILAIDQTFGDIDGITVMTGSTATMELSPRQAEEVQLAARTGAISLTLRSVADADFNNGEALSKPGMFDESDGRSGQIMIYRQGEVSVGG